MASKEQENVAMAQSMWEDPEEVEKLWIAEAKRRTQEINDGSVKGIPAEVVIRELRAKHEMIKRGLADSDAGLTISGGEMARRIRSWRG